MKRRAIIISPEADADLVGIEEWLVEAASIDIAEQFIARIFAFCEALDIASQRGQGVMTFDQACASSGSSID